MGTDGSYSCGEYNIRNKSGESLGCTPASLDHTPEMSRTLSTVLKKKKKDKKLKTVFHRSYVLLKTSCLALLHSLEAKPHCPMERGNE